MVKRCLLVLLFCLIQNPLNAACPCTIFSPTTIPSFIDNDTQSVEVGIKFRSDVDGNITGLRFYKGSTNIGTHTGALWSSTGTLLGSLTFAAETASGWQQTDFATPIAIVANVTYVASYHAPGGHYASAGAFFSSAGIDASPLHALGSASPNGIYSYSTTRIFPTQTYNATNYWVDVVFAPSGAGGGGVQITPSSQLAWDVPADPSTVTGYRLTVDTTVYELGKPTSGTCPDSTTPCYVASLSFLTPGQHTLSVVAYNSNGDSAASNTVQVQMTGNTSVPAKPMGVRVIG